MLSDRNPALEWYEYGLAKPNDYFYTFIMHWVAFNWLYSNSCTTETPFSEREQIIYFCQKNNVVLNTFNALNEYPEAAGVLMEKPIYSENGAATPAYRKHCHETLVSNPTAKNIILSIYFIRCNLFHGAKSLRNPRDEKLVEAASIILNGYLKQLLKIN